MDLLNPTPAADPVPAYHRELTVAEELVVAWIAMGCTRKRIADALHRSIKSVDWHMTNIKLKLGFNDPSRLTHWAISTKLIELNQTV